MDAAGYMPGLIIISMDASNIIETENKIFIDGATCWGGGYPGLEQNMSPYVLFNN